MGDLSLFQCGQVYDMTTGNSSGSNREQWDMASSLMCKTALLDSSGERTSASGGKSWVFGSLIRLLQLSL